MTPNSSPASAIFSRPMISSILAVTPSAGPANQLRLVTSLRRDFYQIPFDPNDPRNSTGEHLRDANRESDAFVAFSWVRTFNAGVMLTVSPFYHFNRAAFESNA